MSAPALDVGTPTLRIMGTPYPVLLPRLRDPRLHLAAVIVSLQVLGQLAFGFDLSIAQILVSLGTCAVLEVVIAFRLRRVILWPASALLTGNGVAFVLRVPGTEHGDWWSMRGWWVFAGTAAVALLSKHLVRFRGSHVFNPSNVGLVACFLLLGPARADPLALWWGPLTAWLGLALAIIVAGGLVILARLRLLAMAAAFWLVFAAGAAVLAWSGHAMTARWHLGPITGMELWRVLVFSPEILVFLFFMITDPRTIPPGRRAQPAFAVAVAALSVVLIAPFTTEFATKVAVLGALTIACGVRPLLALAASSTAVRRLEDRLPSSVLAPVAAVTGAGAVAALLVFTSPSPEIVPARATSPPSGALPTVSVGVSSDVATRLDRAMADRIAADLLAALRTEVEALRTGSRERAADGADGALLAAVWAAIERGAAGPVVVPAYDVARVRLRLEPGPGQGQPIVVATLEGRLVLETWRGEPRALVDRGEPVPFSHTFELRETAGRYVLVGERGGTGTGLLETVAPRTRAAPGPAPGASGLRLRDVAGSVGLDFRHGAFRFGVSGDPEAMMGGGLCWLDADGDGWLDLFVVNAYTESDVAGYRARGGLPRAALFRNRGGTFEDVSGRSGADLALRGSGCVAADFDLDDDTDLYVSGAGYSVETGNYHALLWNDGTGRFTEGARAAGISAPGWYAGAAVADVDGNGLPDLFVAGYTDGNAPIPGASTGFPSNHRAVRDLLYLNEGPDGSGHVRFREVAREAGVERGRVDHGLGAAFSDVNGDGRPDLVVANDEDPNRLYLNVPQPGGAAADPLGLGFRLVDRAPGSGIADDNAGMGVAAADWDADGRPDVLVTNSRRQLHAAFLNSSGPGGVSFADARPALAAAIGPSATGWGASWRDLDLDGDLDLAVANGAIPVRSLRRDARPVQVLLGLAANGEPGRFVNAGADLGLAEDARVNGRGLAAADFDNDGDLDFAVSSIGGRLLLLRTSGARGHWLEVSLARFAPGTLVTAVLADGTRLVRESQAGSSYLSSEDPRLHFGLGDATAVRELVVRRPDGRVTRLTDVRADRVVEIAP